MSDLATALQQVLRQVARETLHTPECDSRTHRACTCDRLERVEAEQARRCGVAIGAGLQALSAPSIRSFTKQKVADAVTVVIETLAGAAQQERGSA